MGCPIIDYERYHNHQRIRLGIEKAKKDGKYKGRVLIQVDENNFKSVCKRWRNKTITARQAMKELGLKPDTFYRRVAQFGL